GLTRFDGRVELWDRRRTKVRNGDWECTLSLMMSLTLLSSSIAPSQFPERISAANLPHAAAVFIATSVDYISNKHSMRIPRYGNGTTNLLQRHKLQYYTEIVQICTTH